MTSSFQPSLLLESNVASEQQRLAQPLIRINRTQLSNGAWVDHLPGWLHDADDRFTDLRALVPWRTEQRLMYERIVRVPRLVAWYPDPTTFPTDWLVQALAMLNQHYAATGVLVNDPLVSAGCCLYRDGDDSVAWHGDRLGRGRTEDTLVAIVSLGNPRIFRLRPTGGGRTLNFQLGHGDLCVMGGSAQRTYEHCVPKSRSALGPRVSIQFRVAGVA
ncbi:MAG: alpha-ketoglutarate-dependent dioxygenase AlkB [Actinomycetia bacterium]|nr:alpha-ketoglutarate-dependent dioxygenase AlkB [Actinomycetes bacterium]